MLDYPKAGQILAQLMIFLHLRQVVSGKILTQLPVEVRDQILEDENIKSHFKNDIAILSEELLYRERIMPLLKQYYANFDDSELRIFLGKEIPAKKWQTFNHLFIRKAIDLALDLTGNEKNACS